MATQTKKPRETAAERKARLAAQTPPQPPQEAQQQQPDGVLLVRVPDGNGGVRIDAQLIGNLSPLEAPAVVEFGLKVVRQQVGLDERK